MGWSMTGRVARGAYRDALVEHAGVTVARALVEAIEYAAGVIAGPVVDALPRMTPDVWLTMDCVRSESRARRSRCACEWCTWEKRNRGRVEEWRRADALRPGERKPAAFGSDADAVEQLIIAAQDGASAPSYIGGLLERMRDEATLGVRMDRAGGREPASLYLAGLRADVWRSYVAACSRLEVRQQATARDAIVAAMSYAIGQPVEDMSLARRARRAVRVELAARDLIPAPRSDLMRRAAEKRREELLRKACYSAADVGER